MTSLSTPGQTIGPFFRFGLDVDRGNQLVPVGSVGAIRLVGTVRDGANEPVPDALVELWQTDAAGAIPAATGSLQRDRSTFTGWGRCHTTELGEFEFITVEPGASFFAVAVFARGLMDVLHTRIYLPGTSDPFLDGLAPERRETLLAERVSGGLRRDIRLQGEHETVFLDYR